MYCRQVADGTKQGARTVARHLRSAPRQDELRRRRWESIESWIVWDSG